MGVIRRKFSELGTAWDNARMHTYNTMNDGIESTRGMSINDILHALEERWAVLHGSKLITIPDLSRTGGLEFGYVEFDSEESVVEFMLRWT